MDPLHERADQPFDVTPEMGAARRSKLEAKAVVIAASSQCLPCEIRATIDVHAIGYAPDGPLRLDLALNKPGLFGKHRVCDAQGDGHFRGFVEGQVHPPNHAIGHIGRHRNPGSADRSTVLFVDDKQIDLGMIDLHDIQGIVNHERSAHGTDFLARVLGAKAPAGNRFRIQGANPPQHGTNALRFSGKTFRVFERELLNGVSWKSGCFTEDSVGDWFLCLPVPYRLAQSIAPREAVGLDLGLKSTVATSDGQKLEAGQFFRQLEQKIAQAQRRGHKRQAKRLHRRPARRRNDSLHKFSRRLVTHYQTIVVGDVSSTQLTKTRLAKAVLDAGWGMLKTQLSYKGRGAGRRVVIVSEKNTTRACSDCGALTGPAGLDMPGVRTWICGECGGTHDRDVNAAKNILSAARGRRP